MCEIAAGLAACKSSKNAATQSNDHGLETARKSALTAKVVSLSRNCCDIISGYEPVYCSIASLVKAYFPQDFLAGSPFLLSKLHARRKFSETATERQLVRQNHLQQTTRAAKGNGGAGVIDLSYYKALIWLRAGADMTSPPTYQSAAAVVFGLAVEGSFVQPADIFIMQVVQALEGAVVGLRDQLEALTILDETALTWPGLSLVCTVHR